MGTADLSSLNAAQRKIAVTLDRPLFVEAGAGSGKTFTLTRRVVWALSEGSGPDGRAFLNDLSQVLVITFTNAAAREIRERVRSSLREAGMHEAALAVDDAWISTIHGMCQRILRRYALELGIDPAFGVCGTHRETQMLDAAVERCVGAARRKARAGSVMASAFEELEYTGVVTRVLALVKCARSAIEGFDSIRMPKGGDVAKAMDDLLRAYEALPAEKLTAKATGVVVPSIASLRAFAELPPGSRTVERAAVAFESCKKPPFSKKYAELCAELKAQYAYVEALLRLERAAEFGPVLLDLARKTSDCYTRLKREQALLDNDDLITLALQAVTHTPSIARRYAGRFKLVMVDEFQDTDVKQLRLISALAGGCQSRDSSVAAPPGGLATVGDAQQSIYRFRGADVSVFNEHGTRVPAEGHVRLDTNYRSHADVLSFVDKVCGGERGVLDEFMHLDASPTRADTYRAQSLARIAVEVVSGPGRGVPALVRTRQLADQVAERLARYRDAGQNAGSMALLLGSTTHAALYIDALRSRGIECVVTGGSTFTSAPEVGVMLNLLRTLANPHDTQSGLFPLLSSEMFELDANDFLSLGTRRQDGLDAPTKRTLDRGLASFALFGGARPSRRLALAHDVLARALESLATRPVADVCLDLVRDSGWLSRLERQGPDGIAREANVLAAIRYIRDLTDEMGLGPVRAAAEFAHWLEVSKLPPASLAGAEQDTLRVMTIHASKGLEYPVVAVAECWSNPRHDSGIWSGTKDGEATVVIDPKGGVKLDGVADAAHSGDLVDVTCGIRDEARAADAQEKARLLYVALTRAREALVLAVNVATSKSGISSDLAAGVVDAVFGGELPPEGEGAFGYGGTAPGSVRHVALEAGMQSAGQTTSLPDAERWVELYPVEEAPLQVVTMGRTREGVFSYSSALAGQQPESAPARPKLPPREQREAEAEGQPASSDEDKATSLGSAFHMIAQAMVEARGDVMPDRVDAICRRWNLSERQRARLDEAVERWATSELRREALGWALVRAEVPFFALAKDSPYGDFVEGAIDLLCTASAECSGDALLIDYKTGDRGLDERQVRDRHAAQAKLYAKVLLSLGFSHVSCAFVAVETGVVARYEFSAPGEEL